MTCAGLLSLLLALALQDAPADKPKDDADTNWRKGLVLTEDEIEIDGEAVPYRATTGRFAMKTEEGKAKADLFFVAYERRDVTDPASRPITFSFNGGPGSSSVWLHMGAFGPRRVPMADDASVGPPPYAAVDNAWSILDVTDLVFIDPVTTGYSRAAEGEDHHQFHGVDEDIASVGEFIRLYTTRMERWRSPKFLAGESYGTTRAAGLSLHLQQQHGLWLNGLILVSSILDFQTARFDPGNDLPYALFLPTYTATAWYHGRLGPDLADLGDALEQSESFAQTDYWLALARGDALPDVERAAIAEQLARYTGLSVEYVLASNLRIQIGRFCKELRRDERLTVGRLDSRYTGRDRDAAGDGYDFDPSYAAIQGPYTAALNAYVREELGYESDLPYEILTSRVQPWNFGRGQGYVNQAEPLREAMTMNPHLQVYVANGFYDLATPYFATEYTFDHLMLEPALRSHITMQEFEAGHMMYVHSPSAAALKAGVKAFIERTSGR